MTEDQDMNASLTQAAESNVTPNRHIGIVGAGVSGLTAASLLAERGFRVHVVDKSRGVGGRTSTRREGELHFDHGAQYFTAQDEHFRQRVASWVDTGIVKEWDGHVVTIENGQIRPSQPLTRYVGVPAMNAIAKYLSNSLQVTTQTRVASLTRRDDQWLLLDDANHQLGCFDALIVGVPPAQAADLLTGLPELAQQVSQCRLVPCWAVMAAFERRLDLPFDGAFVHNSPLTWIARNSSKPGRPLAECWVLHASPEWSTEHIEDAPEPVCEELLAALGRAANIGSLRTIHTAAHRWRYALPSEPITAGCLLDDATRVAVCGDWCQAARIEGAFLSGRAAASRIMNALGVPPGVELTVEGASSNCPERSSERQDVTQ
jgi:predicted NAD/FAD-dependent oxidoreductase